MSLANDVDLEEYVMAKDDLSGADIKAICTEAGLMALRERRMRVNKADFTTAREKVRYSCLKLCLWRDADMLSLGSVPEERGHA
jgi:ATP-dependent 26S proteasome regulatory subunit